MLQEVSEKELAKINDFWSCNRTAGLLHWLQVFSKHIVSLQSGTYQACSGMALPDDRSTGFRCWPFFLKCMKKKFVQLKPIFCAKLICHLIALKFVFRLWNMNTCSSVRYFQWGNLECSVLNQFLKIMEIFSYFCLSSNVIWAQSDYGLAVGSGLVKPITTAKWNQ